MKKESLHEPFSIVFKTLDEDSQLKHQYHFFELIFILLGTGYQCINQHQFAYQAGHMFLNYARRLPFF